MKSQENEALKEADHWHQEAMDIALPASMALKSNRFAEAKNLHKQAFELERKAALAYDQISVDDYWRAVLFRSAAWLAFHAEMYHDSMRMAFAGLDGNPPEGVKQQLLDVLEQALGKVKNSQKMAVKVAA